MKLIKEEFFATLIQDEQKHALLLSPVAEGSTVQVAYALVTLGPRHHILPSVLLDDWGNEVGGIKLYRWINKNGDRFPRAEVFGVNPLGVPTQIFLRDIELFEQYPVYMIDADEEGDNPGSLVQAVLLVDPDVPAPVPTEPPTDLESPLCQGQVVWWRIPSLPADLAFLSDNELGE